MKYAGGSDESGFVHPASLPPSCLSEHASPGAIAETLREEIAQIVGFELEDPRLTMVTVTDVRVADDLRDASVYVTVAGDEKEHQAALSALRHAAPYVASNLAFRSICGVLPRFTLCETGRRTGRTCGPFAAQYSTRIVQKG